MQDQPWDVAWLQANAGRTRMVQEWYGLAQPTMKVHGGSASPAAITMTNISDVFVTGSPSSSNGALS